MESDKRYFIEGLFIIAFAAAIAWAFLWLTSTGHRDDVTYRIHFTESVSGLALGEPVKFHGVDVGTVKSMALDADDPRRVQVDIRLNKDTPVKTDTKASLNLKGITGAVFIELRGGNPNATSLLAATPEGQVPEIASEPSRLASVLDQLPKIIAKFSTIEDQARRVIADVGEVTARVKGSPVLAVLAPKDKEKEKEKTKAATEKQARRSG